MGRFVCVVLCLLFFISCSNKWVVKKRELKSSHLENGYRVYKIDSINDVYVIYARNKDSVYKILSHKEFTNEGVTLKVNHRYDFLLIPIFIKKFDLVNGIEYHNAAIAIEPDSIMKLHSAANVVGLRFVDHPHPIIPTSN